MFECLLFVAWVHRVDSMKMRYFTIAAASAAWILLSLLVGYQTVQETTPNVWDLVQRYALAGFALVATLLASKKSPPL